MPALTRQRTLESILSWWSDSNLPGPTINLHVAAKPLMKLMYHRQALEFVKRNHGVPLSPQIMEIYWSYLTWKYVSNLTKSMILEELAKRVALEDDAARALEQPEMVDKFLQLVQFPNFGIQLQTIMSLLCGNDSNRQGLIGRVLLLLKIADSRDGAQAILAANVLDDVAKHAKDNAVANAAFAALSSIAFWPDGAEAVVAAKALDRVAERYTDVTREALGALATISNWPHGAEAAIAAKLLDHYATRGVPSSDGDQRLMCQLLGNLAKHESTAAAVLAVNPWDSSDFSHNWFSIAEKAFDTLENLTKWPQAAEAAVAAKVLDCLAELLALPDTLMHRSACRVLEGLARRESTSGAVLDLRLKICERLVTLLGNNGWADHQAVDALATIAHWPHGAEAAVAAKVLDQIAERLWDTLPRR
ncbi:armadillo-type protein [Mycena latifolia]|nr:armadillo-type protein [Mycena latifolia]